MSTSAYRVYGLSQSYFTRKLTGYFEYKGIPHLLRRIGGIQPEAMAAGWPGGIPPVRAPDGEWMWDTTAVIEHLEQRLPKPSVLPPDPVQRFLCYALEDVSDEWLYRVAVGTRWFFEENARHAGFELARDVSRQVAIPCDQLFETVRTHVTSTCGAFGVTAENIAAWVDEVLDPWLRALDAHLAASPYLFGARPSLADFALFGADAAHFANDPLCRRWLDAKSPAVVQHTQRLLEPEDESFGDWAPAGQVPDTLVALLADLGRLYLPWVSRACAEGEAELCFAAAPPVRIRATPFLAEARGVLLARYLELRCDALDRVLERAGLLRWFADARERAGAIPDYAKPPRPAQNRPFGPASG